MALIELKSLVWGINTSKESLRKDDEFYDIVNMYYNRRGALETRRGIMNWWDNVGVDPFTSLFFFQNDETGVRYLVGVAGSVMYKYVEGTNSWTSIKTGLTKFEADGVTRTKWCFAVYKNIIYMCDGVNNYARWDGTTYTEYAWTPKFRYIQYMGDRVFGAWVDAAPNTLYYTSAAAAEANNPANVVVVGGDELGRINSIKELGSFICAGKTQKIYSVNVATPSVTPLNSRSGIQSHRSVQNVEGSLVFFNDFGLDTLKQVAAISGTQALGTAVLSEKIRELFVNMIPDSYKTNASLYAPLLNNYYFSFDANNLGSTDTHVVYTSLFGAFTRYSIPSVNDYCTYIDTNGVYRYLIAPSTGWQALEIENGYDDRDVPIEWNCDYRTKFGSDDFKTFSWVQIRGRKNLWVPATLTISVDGSAVSVCSIDDSFIEADSNPYPVWASPIGTLTIGGGVGLSSEIDTFDFTLRIPIEVTGQELWIKIEWNESPLVFSLEQMRVEVNKEVISLFDNYA